MPKVKLTKSVVDKIKFTEKGQTLFCDTELSGFYLIVGMRAKTYIAQKDIQGRSVRVTIGRHGHFTPEEARRIAREHLHLMAQGINPNQLKKEEQEREVTLRAVLDSYCVTRKSLGERTKFDYNYLVGKYLPDWENRLMVEIKKEEIIKRHAEIGKRHGQRVANHTLHVLRALFNHAEATFEICEVNPVTYLSKVKAWFPEKRRRTYIKPHQLKAWWEGVQALENDTFRDFFILLAFTGLRRGEGARLRWEDIDFKDRTLTLPVTKNGDEHTLPMGDYLFDMLESRRQRYGNYVHVFPGSGERGHLAEPRKGVKRVCDTSGITFTCHDLRRTFITIAESLDISSYALKRLLNHRAGDVTSGYIVIDVERLRTPMQRIENFILERVFEK